MAASTQIPDVLDDEIRRTIPQTDRCVTITFADTSEVLEFASTAAGLRWNVGHLPKTASRWRWLANRLRGRPRPISERHNTLINRVDLPVADVGPRYITWEGSLDSYRSELGRIVDALGAEEPADLEVKRL